MNRIILLGNGFDLAHKLKTSYNDFILWYLKLCITEAHDNKKYEDDLIEINSTRNISYLAEFRNIDHYIQRIYEMGLGKMENPEIHLPGKYSFPNPFHIRIKSNLLRTLLLKCSNSLWVDIENQFYYILKSILKEREELKKNKLIDLNKSLSVLIQQLEAYLSITKPTHLHKEYSEIFECSIKSREVVTVDIDDHLPKDTLVLNFNYTSTIEEYFKHNPYHINPKRLNVNYIHGKLNSSSNPIIFGFGDELDSDYEKIELEKTKGFLEFIKSFWYFKTANYHNLIRFLETDDFQVSILGHSCGLSDRTMLNMIFEHDNCKSIKIYYYQAEDGYNNYKDLTQEISRHFKNKGEMRKKIVPFSLSSPMPQILMS